MEDLECLSTVSYASVVLCSQIIRFNNQLFCHTNGSSLSCVEC